MKVLLGMGSSEESRLDNLLKRNAQGSPSFKTNQRLLYPNDLPNLSTYESRGLGWVYEFMSDERFRKLPDSLRFSDTIELAFNLADDYKYHEKLSYGAEFFSGLLVAFPRLISAVIFLESVASGEEKIPRHWNFTPKASVDAFRLGIKQFTPEKKRLVAELHFFVLYMAAAELDITEFEGTCLMPPACFVPSYYRKSIRYPMENFWEWFRSKAGSARWTGFADSMGTTTALLSKYRKAKGLTPSPSYIQLRKFCQSLWPQIGLGRRFQRVLEVTLAYGLARIMQEHAYRCVPLVIEHYCAETDIDNFYLQQIKECKKWVQEIPLHPYFEAE